MCVVVCAYVCGCVCGREGLRVPVMFLLHDHSVRLVEGLALSTQPLGVAAVADQDQEGGRDSLQVGDEDESSVQDQDQDTPVHTPRDEL